MKLQPLAAYRAPDYPTQEILCRHPELLRALPRRWHHNRIVLGALAGLLGLMEQSAARAEDQPTLRVAPVFLHGEGVVAFGGAGGTIRAMLTEAEAREVIEAEAKKSGIAFGKRHHTLKKVIRPITTPYSFLDETQINRGKEPGNANTKTSQKSHLELDGWNAQLQVGYKFISGEDFEAWESDSLKRMAADEAAALYLPTAGTCDMLDTAKRLQAGLGITKEPGTVAVFYEPAATGPKNLKQPSMFLSYDPNDKSLSKTEIKALAKKEEKAWDDYRAAAKEEDKKELRLQVRDFLAWLKAQGVM